MDIERTQEVALALDEVNELQNIVRQINSGGAKQSLSEGTCSEAIDILDALARCLSSIHTAATEDGAQLSTEAFDWLEEVVYPIELFRDTMDDFSSVADMNEECGVLDIPNASAMRVKIDRLQDSVSLPLQLVGASILQSIIERISKEEEAFVDEKAWEGFYKAFALNEVVSFFDHGPFSPVCDQQGPQSCLYLLKGALDPLLDMIRSSPKLVKPSLSKSLAIPAALREQSKMLNILHMKVGARITLLKASCSFDRQSRYGTFTDDELEWATELLPPGRNWLRVMGQSIGEGVRNIRRVLNQSRVTKTLELDLETCGGPSASQSLLNPSKTQDQSEDIPKKATSKAPDMARKFMQKLFKDKASEDTLRLSDESDDPLDSDDFVLVSRPSQ